MWYKEFFPRDIENFLKKQGKDSDKRLQKETRGKL